MIDLPNDIDELKALIKQLLEARVGWSELANSNIYCPINMLLAHVEGAKA